VIAMLSKSSIPASFTACPNQCRFCRAWRTRTAREVDVLFRVTPNRLATSAW